MKNIFIGFIIIFLDFSLNLGNIKIGLIPDFLGYMIMVNGLVQMGGESTLFLKVRPYATGMAVYTAILYIMDLLGVSVSLGLLSFILGFTSVVISLYISYHIVMGVIEMERNYNTNLNGSNLKSTWSLLAFFNVLTLVILLIPLANIVSLLVTFIFAICFLVAFNNSKNLYYNTIGRYR